MNVDQLADDLARAATQVHLRPGSLARARAEGRRRRYRRRRAGVAVTAAAAVGVTGVAIRQLSRPSPSVTSSDVTVPGSTPVVGPPTSAGVAPLAGVPVTEVESPFVWARFDPESTAAVGGSYDGSYRGFDGPVPGVIVSTGPGTEDLRRTLWRSGDGISWESASPLSTGASTATAVSRGDRVYAVGTMPGPSDDAVGPVRVSISDDGGTSWRGVELPMANPALEAVAGIYPVRTAVGGVAATDTFALVLVRQYVEIGDLRSIATGLGLGADDMAVTPEGLALFSCAAATDDVPITVGADDGACAVDGMPDRVVPFSDLGPIGATLEASVRPQQRLFRATDGSTFTEVGLPSTETWWDVSLQTVGDSIVFVNRPSPDSRNVFWQSADGLNWTALSAPPDSSGRVGALGGRLVSLPDAGGPTIDLAEGTTWRRVDVASLYGPDEVPLGLVRLTSGSSSLSGVMAVATPNPGFVEPTIVPQPREPAGLPTATTTMEQSYRDQRYEIVHTVDGTAWSRESVAELAGVETGAISNVSRIQATAGGGVVVAVNLKVPDGELPHQVVLVGTPRE